MFAFNHSKVSHVVTTIILELEKNFGKMTTTKERYHIFSGMDIEFKASGTVTTWTLDYVQDAIYIYIYIYIYSVTLLQKLPQHQLI